MHLLESTAVQRLTQERYQASLAFVTGLTIFDLTMVSRGGIITIHVCPCDKHIGEVIQQGNHFDCSAL